ncbi:hypothetical protein KIPB_014461, partial [Kipferlia bialata]
DGEVVATMAESRPSLCVAEDNGLLAVGVAGYSAYVRMHDLVSNRVVCTFGSYPSVTAMEFNGNRGLLAVGTGTNVTGTSVDLFDLRMGYRSAISLAAGMGDPVQLSMRLNEAVSQCEVAKGPPMAAVASLALDDMRLVAGMADHRVCLWDIRGRAQQQQEWQLQGTGTIQTALVNDSLVVGSQSTDAPLVLLSL